MPEKRGRKNYIGTNISSCNTSELFAHSEVHIAQKQTIGYKPHLAKNHGLKYHSKWSDTQEHAITREVDVNNLLTVRWA